MAIEFTSLELTELKPKVAVIGVGGAGGNAVNNMMRSGVKGVDFIAANTDAQALAQSEAKLKIQLGSEITEGLGAGSHPDVGRAAAEEAISQIEDSLSGCHMVFVTAGMGGGTGTGAAPVIAKAAKAKGILTIAVVTKPFAFEGNRRMKLAEDGIYELQPFVDTLIVIPNQNLFRIANEKTTFAEAFAMADEVLCSGVRGITDLMMQPGLINLDFADIKTIMQNMGTAMMGTGEATGDSRALDAAQTAIANPLLDEMSLASAKGVVINITGGTDLTLFEVDEAANHIRKEVDEDANIIVGSAFHSDLDGMMRVSIVATGVTYLRKGKERPEAIDIYRDETKAKLHFEPEEKTESFAASMHVETQARTEPVGFVDDLADNLEEPEETFEEEQPAAREDMFVADDNVEETEESAFSSPSYEMSEKFAEDDDAFMTEDKRSLFEESLEFVDDNEDPPLVEEPTEDVAKKGLFQKMTAGVKGFFGYNEGDGDYRAEPSMGEFDPVEESEMSDAENILSIDQTKDLEEEGQFQEYDGYVDDLEDEDAAETEAEDQLSIPSFLRKQA